MRIRRFGTSGRPMLYIPGSDGDEIEFERYGMPEVAAEWIAGGQAQFFSIDGSARQTLWNEAIAPAERIRGYAAFERYVAGEVLPWIAGLTPGLLPIVIGVSYGAFVAANLLFKYPAAVRLACGLGGVYGMWHRLDGYHDDLVYFHTPLEYLPRLDNAAILESIRSTGGLVLFAAEDDEWLQSTARMVAVVGEKELPHSVDVWRSPATHHESCWRRQFAAFLNRAAAS